MGSDGGTYVYGITKAAFHPPMKGGGVEGRLVRQIERGPVSALVGDAPAGPIKASRRNLMAHSTVLQHAAAEGCVLPMRFGVVMPSDEAVIEELLAPHEHVLVEQLDAFEQHVELDLKVVCEEETLLRAILAERPDLAEQRDRMRGRSDEETHFERVELGRAVAGAVEAKREELLREVCTRLEPLAASTEVGEPAHEQMLVNVAFLVERGQVERFDAAVQELAAELGPDMHCKYVGPLPPYHFVEVAAEEGSAAWA